MSDFQHKKDSGRLMASLSKKHEKSPDYWGEIAIDVKDLTKVEKTPDGLLVFRLNGWKKRSKTGASFLSLSIDRWLPKGRGASQQDEDVPF
jgi:hypothetical protein